MTSEVFNGEAGTQEFKREAAKLALQPSKAKVQVAKDLGIRINVLRHWMRQFQAGK